MIVVNTSSAAHNADAFFYITAETIDHDDDISVSVGRYWQRANIIRVNSGETAALGHRLRFK
jgi:hypothetical protein